MKQSHRAEIFRDGFGTTCNRFLFSNLNTKNEHAGHGNADDPDDGQDQFGSDDLMRSLL